MKKIFGSLRWKVIILALLVGLTFQIGWNTENAAACEECVPLTGGLCVGCDPNATVGHVSCVPNQDTCSCEVSGACKTENDPPGGGGNGN